VPEGKVDVPRIWGWADEQPSWTWPGAEGRPLAVRIYTTGDRVDVHLNGRKLDSKQVSARVGQSIEFTLTYEPGVLEAVAFRDGKQIARKQLVTVGAPAAIRLTPERSKHGAARSEVSYVAVEIVDAAGRVVPDVSKEVEISITGTGELVAFGSANPLAVGSFQSRVAKTWNGRALMIVRGTGRAGSVTIDARADGLRAGSTELRLV
jgi:beta-galactosidase